MVDNTVLDAGAGGDTIATDDIGGIKFQRVKLIHGADGTNDGDVSTTNPLPVSTRNTISTNNSTTSTLGISGNFTATADDVSDYKSISVQLDSSHDSATDGMTFEFSTDNTNFDDVYTFTYTAADGARRFQFPVTAQFFRINYTNGGTAQTHFRVQTILHRGNILTSIHRLSADVDPDRSAQLMKTAIFAQAAGSGDFTAVDATAGGNLKVAVEEITDPVGGGTEAAALRVTLANDSTGLVSVDDNGGSLTVDGTVTANLSATDNAVLDQIEVNTSYGDNTGNGTAAGALRVTVASDTTGVLSVDDNGGSLTVDGSVSITGSLPAGTNNIGDVDIASALPAGTNNIGDVDVASLPASTNTIEVVGDVAHDAAAAGNPILLAGIAQDVDDTAPPNRISTESDATRLATDFDGAIFARPHGPQIWSHHTDSSSAQTDTTVHAAPGAGLSLYVTDIVFSSGAATAINLFFEEATTTVLGPYYLEAVAGRGMSIHFQTPKKITANTALTFTTSAAIAHSVDVTGYTAQG